MRRPEIEALALRVVDRVRHRQPNEDVRVELKREWVDPIKGAAQIAAHANAARGEPIVWLFGVDEGAGDVPGVSNEEFSEWWSRVRAEFDQGLAPDLDNSPLVVPLDHGAVVAVAMDTSRPPYVIKNAAGGQIGHWVPFRDGNATRAARHADLIRILVPITRVPTPEVLWADVNMYDYLSDNVELTQWAGMCTFYAALPQGESIVFPWHRASMDLYFGPDTASPSIPLNLTNLSSNQKNHPFIDDSHDQVVLRRAGSLRIDGIVPTPRGTYEVHGPVMLRIALGSPDTDVPLAFTQLIEPSDSEPDKWSFQLGDHSR